MRGERSVDDVSRLMAAVRVQAELVSAVALEQRMDALEQHTAGVPQPFARLSKLKEVA
jgi:hypothetical protein